MDGESLTWVGKLPLLCCSVRLSPQLTLVRVCAKRAHSFEGRRPCEAVKERKEKEITSVLPFSADWCKTTMLPPSLTGLLRDKKGK